MSGKAHLIEEVLRQTRGIGNEWERDEIEALSERLAVWLFPPSPFEAVVYEADDVCVTFERNAVRIEWGEHRMGSEVDEQTRRDVARMWGGDR